MIVLGLDTSGYANAIGIAENGRVLADVNCEARNDSLEKIVTNMDSVLKQAGLTLNDVNGIGVGLGPGSWTGIRVGVTVGKMLALASGKPVIGVPTFEALAFAAGDSGQMVCTVISTGAGDAVYAARYRVSRLDITHDGEYYVGDIAGLAAAIREPAVIAGNGAARYAREIEGLIPPGIKISAAEVLPGGAAVARLAERRLERGESDDPLALSPLYLKESTARAFVNKYARREAGA